MAKSVSGRKPADPEATAKRAAKKAGTTAKRASATPKSRTKIPKEVRLKAYWGVFDHSLKRVALFEYSERKQADKKAEELAAKKNLPYFVQNVKEVIEE